MDREHLDRFEALEKRVKAIEDKLMPQSLHPDDTSCFGRPVPDTKEARQLAADPLGYAAEYFPGQQNAAVEGD